MRKNFIRFSLLMLLLAAAPQISSSSNTIAAGQNTKLVDHDGSATGAGSSQSVPETLCVGISQVPARSRC